MESLATVEELAKSWKPLTTSERERAEVLLEQSSNYLRQVALNNHKDIDAMIMADTGGVFQANVKAVILASVQRVMASPMEMMPDANSWSQSASPYSESMSFASETSTTLFFKKRELELLGLGTVGGRKSIGILRGARG